MHVQAVCRLVAVRVRPECLCFSNRRGAEGWWLRLSDRCAVPGQDVITKTIKLKTETM